MSGARHYNNLGGRTPIGTPDRERLESYTGQMNTGYSWNKIYVEGIPTNVTMVGR